MFELIVSIALWAVSYPLPLILAARSIRSPTARPVETFNYTLSLVMIWFLEMMDAVVLSRLIAAKVLYMVVRIAFTLYLLHPFYLGATVVYARCLQGFVESYSSSIDLLITNQLKELRSTGVVRYIAGVIDSSLAATKSVVSNTVQSPDAKLE